MSNDPFSKDYDPSLPKENIKILSTCDKCENFINSVHMDELMKKLDGRKTLVLSIHGSNLYGLNGENSDLDMKGVFFPTLKELVLNRFPSVIKYSSSNDSKKCTKDDVEVELYSIHHFFKLLKEGDTGAISLIYTPTHQICSQRPSWQTILENKNLFLSKNMAGLLGFVRTQTNKYCIKGERLASANLAVSKLSEIILEFGEAVKLKEVWDYLPFNRHILLEYQNDQRFWSVCGRKVQDTNSAIYALNIAASVINSYGKRAKEAEEAGGLDLKAISHAFRVASELSDIYKNGMILYPLKDAQKIKRIKAGDANFDTEVLPELNSLIDNVNEMAQLSNYPDELDIGKINNFMFDFLTSNYKIREK